MNRQAKIEGSQRMSTDPSSGRQPRETIGQIDAQPGLEHPAMHGPLVAGESASHSAAVQRGAHQLVDQVDGIRFVVNPFGKNCGG
ncbi:MAG: hypothetical protein CM1200mP26_26990 [Acidimicrobiales bacterium]|nr:MAG: hypothetical protein CM1200mP26_26990 [Acidimicrobiales bacterium]